MSRETGTDVIIEIQLVLPFDKSRYVEWTLKSEIMW